MTGTRPGTWKGAALAALGLLVACGTPQEQCIRAATRDLRTVNALVKESEANLARGYAWEYYEVDRTVWVICDYYYADDGRRAYPRYCLDNVSDTIRRPVAIDPAVEKRKLQNLKERQRALSRAAEPAIAACEARYPE
jgi:hypothetical protein